MPLTIVIEEKAVDEEKLFLTELLYNACRPDELFSKKLKQLFMVLELIQML